MGAFDAVIPITIPDPSDEKAAAAFRKKWSWEPHEVITIKARLTVADQEYATNQTAKLAKDGATTDVLLGNGRFALLDRMIVAWSLTQNGRTVPVSPAAIRQLPSNYSVPVLDMIDKIVAPMQEEDQQNFLTSANGHITENYK